jgi:hypothetical protein
VELADHVRLNRLIKQYSQFITFPIKLYSPKKEPKQVGGGEGRAAAAGSWAGGRARSVRPPLPQGRRRQAARLPPPPHYDKP